MISISRVTHISGMTVALPEGHPDQHQAAAGGDQVGCGVEQGRMTGAFDDRRRRGDVAAHLAELGDHGCGAEIQRELAAILDRIDPDDRADATSVQRGHREAARSSRGR